MPSAASRNAWTATEVAVPSKDLKQMNKTILILGGVAIALVALIAVLFVFGTPSQGAPDAVYTSASPTDAGASGAMREPGTPPPPKPKVPADAKAPAPDPSSPLAIQIPGCVCHS